MNELSFAKLMIEAGPSEGREIELDRTEFLIGREPGMDLVVPLPAISRRHARIFQQKGQYFLEDLGSSNGTYLNGEQISAAVKLSAGDVIYIGKAIRLKFLPPISQQSTLLDQESPDVIEATLHEVAQTPSEVDRAAETQFGSDHLMHPASPPKLMVQVAGGQSISYTLEGEHFSIGRNPENDIILSSQIVSGKHAQIDYENGSYYFEVFPEAANPVYLEGQILENRHALHHNDIFRIGSRDPGLMVTITVSWPEEKQRDLELRTIDFSERSQVQIGRDSNNDVVLDAPTVSRYHALIEKIGQRFRVRDLNSSNGTFVNDRRVETETWLSEGDDLVIGPFKFVMGPDQLAQSVHALGMLVEVRGLNKWVRPDLNLLKDISLIFEPREFIVVVGQSGGGKSTLVDAIAGFRPATDGRVLVNDIDIYQNFDAVRNEIGFVPQKDIIHMELTVYQALDYAAQLRMPADTSPDERHQRILEVLADLDLTHRKDVQISGLSGGQQKRVSIGVELLTKPGLFFLDEPSSGLDPGTETSLMHLMRRLADQGRTIVLITHATKNVMLADKVVFLARGGYLAWFGPPDEALEYFDQFRSERDRRARSMEFDEIYAILDDPENGSAEEWAQRYQQTTAYQRQIIDPLTERGYSPGQAGSAESVQPGKKSELRPHRNQVSGLRQFRILSSRNIKILTRDRASLFLMLVSAPLVAMLDVVLAFILGRDLYSFANGDMANAITSLFQPIIFAIMVGALAQMREFVKESDIYKRERLVNLKVFPYVMSKVWVAALLALYQAAAYTIIHFLAFRMPGGVLEFSLFYFTLVLATMAGMMLGLFASAIAPNANAAPLIVILLIIPQVVLGGALIPVPDAVSAPMSSRWAFEAVVGISGIGSDVAADLCWQLPEESHEAMSLDDKIANQCNCMGLNSLKEETCNFPGLGEFYDPVIDEPEPVEPAALGDPPVEPEIPSPPEEPANQTDQVAVAQYLQALKQYQDDVKEIQDDYKLQIEDYQARADVFTAEMVKYQEDRGLWEIERNAAVGKAEGTIGTFKENFGWAFVNKANASKFWSSLLIAWGVQLLIITVLFFGTLFAIYRKDRA